MHYRGEIRHRGLVEGRPAVHDDAPFAWYALSRLDQRADVPN